MTPPSDIETRVLNTRIKPRAEMRGKVLADVLRTQEAHNLHSLARVSFNTWRTIMRSRTAQCAAAAIIVSAVLLGIHLSGSSIDGARVVWAEVVEQMNNHTKYKCRMRVVREEGPPVPTMQVYHLNLSQRRQEVENGDIHIIDMRGEDAITVELCPAKKKGTVTKLIGMGPRKDPDIIDMVKRVGAASTERLGSKERNGETLHGFRHQPNKHNDFIVWVDGETKLPVEIELRHSQVGQTIFMDEFAFDFELDPSAFSTDVPDGYDVKTVIADYRPVEPKQVTTEEIRSGLNHSAYAVGKLPWMEKVVMIQASDPLGTRVKVYMTGILSDSGNTIIIIQGDLYDGERMIWLPKQELLLETTGGAKLYSHPRGSDYARFHLESFSKANPDFFNAEELSNERFGKMIVLPDGTIMGLSANKNMSNQQLEELIGSLTEIEAD